MEFCLYFKSLVYFVTSSTITTCLRVLGGSTDLKVDTGSEVSLPTPFSVEEHRKKGLGVKIRDRPKEEGVERD